MNLENIKLTPPAFYGLAGEVVQIIFPHTESDEAALLIQLLVCYGNIIDRNPYFVAESTKHFSNLFVLVVGLSSKGRKGSSLNQILNIFDDNEVYRNWRSNCHIKGLSSSEGIVNRICDKATEPGQNILPSQLAPINDKRLLCLETEFANTLSVMKRNGNTLSALLRDAWDGSDFQTTTKGSPQKATNPHVSIIGHITYSELQSQINPVDIKNGLGNRFLFINSRRSKMLPNGNPIELEKLNYLRNQIKISYEFAIKQKEMKFTEEAQLYWNNLYVNSSSESYGIFSDLTGREAAQIKRIAMIYSLMNLENEISIGALKASEAVWKYNCDSIRSIFGASFGCYKIDRLLNILKEFGEEGRSRSDLILDTGKNYGIGKELEFLENLGLIFKRQIPTGKKPRIVYFLSEFKTVNE